MKESTCCFSGHRNLPSSQIENIVKRLNDVIDDLINQGVTDFLSGGAIGFDLIAASMIFAKREMGYAVRLIFALPCRSQDAFWSDDQKRLYRGLLEQADEIIYVSDEYDSACMKRRNHYLVDRSGYCVYALINERSGTGQTVRYALQNSLKVINVMSK